MKRIWLSFVVAFVVLLVLAEVLFAAPITYSFSSSVTIANDPYGLLTGSPLDMQNSVFTGTFTYDTEAASTSGGTLNGGTLANYPLQGFSAVLDGVYSLGTSYNRRVQVLNSDSTFQDWFYPQAQIPADGVVTTDSWQSIQLQLIDDTGTLYQDTSLPMSLSLDDYSDAWFFWSGATQANQSFQVQALVTSLTRVTAVPEPSSLFLVSSGLLIFLGGRRNSRGRQDSSKDIH